MRTPLAIIMVLAAVLLAGWIAFEDDDAPATPPPRASVAVIAHRVEALRDLRFRALPEPLEVSAAQARREGLEAFDRDYPAARQRADETIYKTLGLLEPDAHLRDVAGSLFEQGVAGYYDPRDGRLRVVTGAGTGNRVLSEMTLAHELTHALEDQAFDFPEESSGDDGALARSALTEGTASVLMQAYVLRHFSSEETLGSLVGSAFQDTGDLPPFIEAQVLFPYLDGARFVEDLLQRAGGRWELVDTAYRLRMPASTEQILHPAAYFDADEPETVRLRAGAVLGPGWKRTTAGTWGELQTRELLSFAGGNSAEAARGWGGDRYELWRSGAGSALLMRWRWDTRRDEREFAAALREWADSKVEGPYDVVVRGGAVTLIAAPDAATVRRLAAA